MGKPDIQERSFQFACRIVKLCDYLVTRKGHTRTLSRQILRSGTSIGANLEEASAGQSRADFVTKCCIALKEARETHYWLRLLAASNRIQAERLTLLITECNELIAILTTIVRKASTRRT